MHRVYNSVQLCTVLRSPYKWRYNAPAGASEIGAAAPSTATHSLWPPLPHAETHSDTTARRLEGFTMMPLPSLAGVQRPEVMQLKHKICVNTLQSNSSHIHPNVGSNTDGRAFRRRLPTPHIPNIFLTWALCLHSISSYMFITWYLMTHVLFVCTISELH